MASEKNEQKMEKEVSFADSESSSEKEAPRDFIISRAHSFKRDEHPAHPFVGFTMWSFMLWIWYQVWGVWCIPISSYFVYLVLLIPPWITGKSEQQIRKQEEVSAFIYILATACTVPVLCYWCLFRAPTAITMAFLCYVGWFLLLDSKAPKSGKRKFDVIRRRRQWYNFARYFPISLSRTAELDPTKNYIFGYHPHGIISTGALCNFGAEATGFSTLFPGIDLRLLTLAVNFYVPFLREYFLALGVNDVSRESCITNLRRGPGASIMIVVGGAAEALEARPNEYDLTISTKRKGFVKIALQEGASMVPVFSFGEVDVFNQWANPEGSKLRRFQKWSTSIFGISPPIVVGRALKSGVLKRWFGWNWGIMPLRMPVHSVVGAPIDCPKIAPDADEKTLSEAIDKYHALYLEELKKVYEDHKESFKDLRKEYVEQQEPDLQEILKLGKEGSFKVKGL
mmetsp:Transcript_9778/g.23229  ORF Transcript_9778/g.23229 Transcript_9778/m.23229 type:complete len:454 (+) Transcript_9778:1-1362(+)